MSEGRDKKVVILEKWPFQVIDLTQTTIWEKQQIKDGIKAALQTQDQSDKGGVSA